MSAPDGEYSPDDGYSPVQHYAGRRSSAAGRQGVPSSRLGGGGGGGGVTQYEGGVVARVPASPVGRGASMGMPAARRASVGSPTRPTVPSNASFPQYHPAQRRSSNSIAAGPFRGSSVYNHAGEPLHSTASAPGYQLSIGSNGSGGTKALPPLKPVQQQQQQQQQQYQHHQQQQQHHHRREQQQQHHRDQQQHQHHQQRQVVLHSGHHQNHANPVAPPGMPVPQRYPSYTGSVRANVPQTPSVSMPPLTEEEVERNIAARVDVLNRVGKMLRRKVGHEREDKAYDSLMRTKTVHIILFSMMGLVSMIVGGCVTWYTGEFRTDTRWKNAGPHIKTVMLCLQIVTSLTTLVTICLIVQYYRLLLLNKRREWAQMEDQVEELMSATNEGSYSFWKSSWLRASLTMEILVHIVHPVFLMQDLSYTLFTLCQIYMFLRLYLFIRAMHTFSRAYQLRIEIINSNRDFQTMNLRIKMGLTLKMLFYSRTTLVLSGAFMAVILVFSFMIFLVERDAQRNSFGRLENVMWFSFITFTTIGFGDFVPKTVPGRVITVLLGVCGVVITTIFSGVLTNKLVPTKIQRYVVEYLQVRKTLETYREAAARLVQASYRAYLLRKLSRRNTAMSGHKSNRVYGAVKSFRRARFDVKGAVLPSTDPVLEEKMMATKKYLKDLDSKLSAQHETMISLQSKIEDELGSIIRALNK